MSDKIADRALLLDTQAETLKELRASRKLSQQQLAGLAGISVRGYRYLEDATRLANQSTLAQLLRALGMNLAEWEVTHNAAMERVQRGTKRKPAPRKGATESAWSVGKTAAFLEVYNAMRRRMQIEREHQQLSRIVHALGLIRRGPAS